MSITKEQLYNIYEHYLPVFMNITKDAQKFGVTLDVRLDNDGSIKLESSEYEITADKKICRTHHIFQSEDHVSDGNDTYVWKKGNT